MKDNDSRRACHSRDLKKLRRRIDDLESGGKPEREELRDALVEVLRHRTEALALLESAGAILTSHEFESAAISIFDACKEATGATAGYVGLLNEDRSEIEVVFLDAGGLPCAVDPSLPMPTRSLRAEAYGDGKTVYDNDFSGSGWMKLMPAGHVDLRNVMFAPMNLDGETVGLIGLANKPGDFTEDDARIASMFGEFAAIALQNSNYLDSLSKANGVLQRQVFHRKHAEAALQKAYDEMERRVDERTIEWSAANANLKREIEERKRTETALRQSEARWRSLTENSADYITLLSRDTKILFMNHTTPDTAHRIIGKSAYDFFPEKYWPAMKESYDYVLRTGEPSQHDVVYTDPDGADRAFEAHVSPILVDGEVTALVVSARDITERKRAEQALRESEEKFSKTFHSNPTLMVISQIADGRLIEVNDVVLNVLGYEREELIGQSTLDLNFWVDPDDSRRVIESAQKERRTMSGEALGRKKTGEVLPLLISGDIIEINGRQCLIIAAVDITERRRANEEIRFLGQIAEQTASSVITTDLEYKITYMNRAFQDLYGYSREELIGQSPDILNAEPDSEQMEKDIYQTVSSGKTWRGEALNRRKDGSVFPCELTVSPLVDELGEIFAYAGSQNDITERKQMEEERQRMERQIQHAQKLESLGVLAGGIAHDFNNLLTGILGNAQLGKLNLSPTSPAVRNLEEIEKASQRAADLSNQMLAYSGQGRFRIESINLNDIVLDMRHLLEASISKKVALKCNLDEDLPSTRADVTQIRQVIMNLITNASESIGDVSGVAALTTGTMDCDADYLANTYLDEKLEPGKYVWLKVADTGCGMDEETQRKLFDPFFTTKFTGRGLGMAATLGIVRGHNGAIKVDSEPGKGSTFRVLFPTDKKPVEKETASRAAPLPQEWRGSGGVLLVDDEETVRTVAGEMLEAMGFTVQTANDGVEAVEIFGERSDEIDLVLLDMSMPRMNGAEAFDQIKLIRPDARVILSSGFGAQEALRRFEGKGLSGFIKKPYTYNALVEIVKKVTETR